MRGGRLPHALEACDVRDTKARSLAVSCLVVPLTLQMRASSTHAGPATVAVGVAVGD